MKMLAQNCSKSLLMSLLIGLVFMFNACKGTQGEVGPKGDKGDTGATGPQGPKGDTGPAGSGGGTTTASNVFYSNWISVQFGGSGENYSATINAPKITQEIIDKGTVVTYAKSNISGNVIPLPFAALNGTTRTTVVYNLGKVLLGANFDASSQTYRYIIFPAGTSIGAGRKANVDFSNYEAVKAYYHLKD